MKIEQIYTKCLAQGTYYITDGNEAVIIDPLREIQPYLDKLKADNVSLKYIFETHFHADFVSGHIDLSKSTGAPIVYGPTASPDFECIIAEDNQVFEVGECKIKVLHTPGHTMESVTLLLLDETGKEHCIFSGDTLFLGDVGRPDLAQKSGSITQQELAGFLYDSLMTKIIPLPNNVIVYPAHGAGSACGKNMMKETVDTLGNQKKINYALNQPNKEAFISAVLDGLGQPPEYFGSMVQMNKGGYKEIGSIIEKNAKPLTPDEIDSIRLKGEATILDTRNSAVFCKGFIPGAINIGLKGGFAPWVGAVLKDVKRPLILVVERGTEEEAIIRLSRVGFDNVLGFLDGGFSSWEASGKEIDTVNRVEAQTFYNQYKADKNPIYDVRKEGEYASIHVEDALFRTLDEIDDWFDEIDDSNHFFIHCAGGYRSMIAASVLKAKGITNFSEIDGGMNAIAKIDLPKGSLV